MEIKNIIVHHSGGLGNDNNASTIHLTPQQISNYHKQRWNMPSLIQDESIRYAGYNIIFDPKSNDFVQCRAIGEETIATKGKNFDSIHICIIGNYNKKYPRGDELVDPMNENTADEVTKLLLNLIDGNHGLFVAPNTTLNLSKSRIYPHRAFSNTECNGMGLDDNFFMKRVMDYKIEKSNVVYSPSLIADIQKLITMLYKLIESIIISKGELGSTEHPENFNQ